VKINSNIGPGFGADWVPSKSELVALVQIGPSKSELVDGAVHLDDELHVALLAIISAPSRSVPSLYGSPSEAGSVLRGDEAVVCNSSIHRGT
jgi:hypothetical protein